MAVLRTIKVLYKDKIAWWLINVSILSILATWSLFLFKKIVASPLAVLHYNIYAGIDVLGNWYWLYLLPALALLISILDCLLAITFWTRFRIMSYFLLTIVLLVNIFMFLFLNNILNYNL